MVPPGIVPFDGIFIDPIDTIAEEQVISIRRDFENGLLSANEVESELTRMCKTGKIEIELNTLRGGAGHAVGARPRFTNKSKKKWRNKKPNPMKGKGESYADHVEHGWGQNVPVTNNDPDLDGDDLDGLWR